MTAPATTAGGQPRRLGRSVFAVFLGFVTVVVLSLGTDQILHVLKVYPPWGQPMYQPGQTIHLRALALNAFTLKPRAGDVQVEVLDSKGNQIFSRKLALSEFGIASADLTLDRYDLQRLANAAGGFGVKPSVLQ